MITKKQRELIVKEAQSWLRTPYHHCADIKNNRVDCAMFLIRVYSNVGLIPYSDPRPYAPDWHLHRSEEMYLQKVMPYAEETGEPLPGDFILYKPGRTYSHSAIVIDHPTIIHAHAIERMVVLSDESISPLRFRDKKIFTLKGKSWMEF